MPKQTSSTGQGHTKDVSPVLPWSQWRVSANADAFRQKASVQTTESTSVCGVSRLCTQGWGRENLVQSHTRADFFFFYNKCCCLAMKSSPVCSCSNWLGSQAANCGPQSNRTHACPVFNHATWLGCSYKLAILPGQLLARKWNCCFPELFFLPCPLPLDAAKPFSMVVFHCRHMFHKECLPVPSMVSGWLGHHQLESSWCSQRDVLKMITILLGHPLAQSYNLHLCLTVSLSHQKKWWACFSNVKLLSTR